MPNRRACHIPVLQRIGMQIIHMLAEVSFVSNEMLPEQVLP
jgi:hypothetical protein